MILVQNMVFITGIIGFILVLCLSGLGSHLYLHRVFSLYRRKNLKEVYRYVGLKTICVSGVLCLIYKILELAGLLEPMGFCGLLVIVWMTLLASMIMHGYAPVLQGMGWMLVLLAGIFGAGFLIVISWKNLRTDLYLPQITVILFAMNLCMWAIHKRLWETADFMS